MFAGHGKRLNAKITHHNGHGNKKKCITSQHIQSITPEVGNMAVFKCEQQQLDDGQAGKKIVNTKHNKHF